MLFDYETLKIIWWLLVGALLIGFAIMDGHDMGVCSLLLFVGKDDEEQKAAKAAAEGGHPGQVVFVFLGEGWTDLGGSICPIRACTSIWFGSLRICRETFQVTITAYTQRIVR